MYNGNDNNNSYNNNMGGMNNNFNFSREDFEEKRKKRKKNAKIAGVVVGALLLTITSGLLGGVVTYKIMAKDKVVGSTSYAAPEFTSASEGSLTASQAFEKVKPAVVTISTKSIQSTNNGLFSQEVEGLGSGFIINEDGYILTNNHVVQGSDDVKVLLSDGSEVSAKVINTDPYEDLAMIKLADGTKVPGVAELGDSDALYPGEDVIAIGTPLSKSFAQTMTKGIVSAVNRDVESESGTSIKVIQTDAAINAGNSGGPLVNTKGQVIGINSMKMGSAAAGSQGSSIEGMGFSIPINEAKSRLESLSKPIISLGIKVFDLTPELAKKYDSPEGVYVKEISDFSPAAKAGMKQGDIIIKFDGTKIKTGKELNELKEKKNAGDKVKITVSRDKKEVELEVELAQK
ncbi:MULTISPECIES: trypsin-like peptidase domain-containing protein [Clostridium]|uniref:Trypsin-like peptidase domain-containing protein n=1 Tax=Clostridium cibarium TaxID=2762247 RepID=A0ABR8PWV8_9CLOT|nr:MULTISPECIES: trypsin-like peptidase domain-containing protein [Clostridium]MBD7912608.1 trypsin-like peptidase domain-containing protein [Clostridium cibarium]